MIHGRVPVSNATSARAPRGGWKGLRVLFLMLTAALWAAARLAPGSLKASSLRLLARHVGALEHGLRCLLLLMRGAPPPAATVPEGLPRSSAPRRAGLKAPRFSLSLAALAKGFARNGHDVSALAPARKSAAAPTPRPPLIPAAPALPVIDPADLLKARLDALRAVFADPHGHAARLAANLHARGFCLRALKALIPAAALWCLTSHRAACHNHALPVPAPNTS